MADLRIEWGDRLRALRTERELSQKALATKAGIDPGNYARIELGQVGIGDDGRIRLAAALGVRVEEIFSYPDTTTQESKCPSAANAPDGDASPTPETTAAPRSDARSAAAPDESAPEASRASDREAS